jgi:uncharacterized protein YndB with AHSA1/START domain
MSRRLKLSRLFRAPLALTWKLWTEPAYVSMWWGIKGCTIPVCELDVRPGGIWRIDMRTADGTVYRNGGEYLEVEPQRRLVYSDVPDAATAEWEGKLPGTRRNTVTFSPEGELSRVAIEISFATAEDHERFMSLGIHRGIEQSLDRLDALIASLGAAARG